MQIVGNPEKPKSREPLILPGLWRITQVLLPSGTIECKFTFRVCVANDGQSPSSPILCTKNPHLLKKVWIFMVHKRMFISYCARLFKKYNLIF